ncbi:hypothetical protein H1O16_gp390 [Burkholderia phage BcepSaruman]|uniref:Uncharacterized protein n=1 Tax=Burkholderia phage BcepSaruman TaxID=2530032 RepID=A0A4D5ZCN2_9CAUD|nr:hypothetical protein H1O16_gp390 [Burkholderia phage BcepSaruman]QBX06803.1 hypothetical protein BcepSaruman_390 [Burkholderia phage BcepSaruman]
MTEEFNNAKIRYTARCVLRVARDRMVDGRNSMICFALFEAREECMRSVHQMQRTGMITERERRDQFRYLTEATDRLTARIHAALSPVGSYSAWLYHTGQVHIDDQDTAKLRESRIAWMDFMLENWL